MISLTRLLARQLRAMMRRTFSLSARGWGPPVVLETDAGGLTVRAQTDVGALEYRGPGVLSPERLVVPYMLLVDCEGTNPTPVTIEKSSKDRLVCNWHEKQVPVMVPYDAISLPEKPFPARPANLLANDPGLLAALDDAMELTDPNSARFALGCVQLRGSTGELAATNGHHLLLQTGGHFPWSEDLLIPKTTVFGSKELAAELPVHVGKTDDWVSFLIGRWTFHVAIQREGRFPNVDREIRDPETAGARLRFSPGDAKFLLDNLEHLSHGELDGEQPVTVELNGSVAVRAKSDEQPRPMELVLTNSRYSGNPTCINTDRRYLARALRMGLLELCYFDAKTSLQCRDDRRKYVWMPLNSEGAIAADAQTVRIESPTENGSAPSPSAKRITRSMSRKKQPTTPATPAAESTNGHVPHDNPVTPSLPAPVVPASAVASELPPTTDTTETRESSGTAIEQALALRDSLRGVLAQTSDLVTTLRREKKQARLVASTLASLKQLQAVS